MSKRKCPPSPSPSVEVMEPVPQTKVLKLEPGPDNTPHTDVTFSVTDRHGNRQDAFAFDNGIVILRTAGTPQTLFKVSKALFCQQSSVFTEMLASAQSSDEAIYENSPIVDVEDSPADLQPFLKALHDPWSYFSDDNWKGPRTTKSVLFLAMKYGVKDIRKRLLDHLVHYYPSSLDKYQERGKPKYPIYFTHLTYARLVNASRILPVAFYYSAVSFSVAELISAPSARVDRNHCYFSDPRDKSACLAGREALMRRTMEFINRTRDCVAPCGLDGCKDAMKEWISLRMAQLPDPLLNGKNIHPDKAKFCRACATAIKNEIEKSRQDLWNDLPGIFGLPDWETLLKESES